MPFCSTTFQQAFETLEHGLVAIDYPYVNESVVFPMNGRGLKPSFQRTVLSMPYPSAHAKLQAHALLAPMKTALKTLREHHRLASGGLPPDIWNQGRLAWNGKKLRYAHLAMGTHETTTSLCQDAATLTARLARHAALPLEGTPRVFHLSHSQQTRRIIISHAPTPILALMRVMILHGSDLSGWNNPVLAEQFSPTLFSQARAALRA